jgi:hypothetical protein
MPATTNEPGGGLEAKVLERLARGLEAVLPWAARAVRPATRLAVAGGAAAAVLVIALARSSTPAGVVDWLALALVGGLLLAPAVVLVLFVVTLRQLLELPWVLRDLPATGRAVGERLAALAGEVRRPRAGGRRGTLGSAWRAGRALAGIGGALEPFTAVAGLARLPFLLLVAAAAGAAVVEVGLALAVLLLWAA